MWRKALIISILPFLFLSSYQLPLSQDSIQIQKRYADALEAILGVGIRLQAILEDPKASQNNLLVSPISVTVSLAQLILGAEGEFRDQLYYLLSLPNTKEEDKSTVISFFHKNNNFSHVLPYARLHLQLGALLRVLAKDAADKSFQLSCSSAWFVNKDIKLKREFEHNLAIYESDIHKMNFSDDPLGSQKLINKWSADHTNQLIKTILHTPLPSTASAVLLNAIYFRGDWETPFSDELNIPGPFQVSPNKVVQVTYMRGFLESVPYIENKEKRVKLVGLPYKNDELMMYIIIPTDDHEDKFNLRKLVMSMKSSDILEMISSAKRKQVMVTLPKMQLSNTISVLEPLEKFLEYKSKQKQLEKTVDTNLTVNTVDILEKKVEEFVTFRSMENREIRLTGASDDENFKLTGMMQQMSFSVNEKGTEAAAVTMSIIDYIGGNKQLKVDRPFLFFIRHELTTAVLFWGIITDPSQES